MDNSLKTLKQYTTELLQLLEQLDTADELSELDKATLQQKCIRLYEGIIQLTVTKYNSKPESEAKSETISHSLPVAEPIVVPEIVTPIERVIEAKTTDIIPVELKETAPSLFDTVIIEKTETELQNERIDEIVEQKQQEKITSQPELSNSLAPELSLLDKIANSIQPKPHLLERLSANTTSLKSAINVNLKIAIVQQLFKENTVEYVKAIDKLNASENIHEAMRYFSELKHTYDWQNDHPLVKELESLLNKRFPA